MISAFTTPIVTTEDITWTAETPNIVTIDELDDDWVVINARNVGETVITAKTKKEKLTASAIVIVNPIKIDDDYATQIPGFYFGNTKINAETVDLKKLITVKYYDRNKMVFSIDEKFKLSRTENVECVIKTDHIADVIEIENYRYKAAGEISVTIKGTTYPATIEAVFNTNLTMTIKINNVPELGNVIINFEGREQYKID
ncbi:MAG: hypothetical protein FWC10_07700 [Lentimicrobiaceae bacterium]|nr:hypothetical protein [Lentimicrobiaceae bacterium]